MKIRPKITLKKEHNCPRTVKSRNKSNINSGVFAWEGETVNDFRFEFNKNLGEGGILEREREGGGGGGGRVRGGGKN